jgi:hypothetical protein
MCVKVSCFFLVSFVIKFTALATVQGSTEMGGGGGSEIVKFTALCSTAQYRDMGVVGVEGGGGSAVRKIY